MTKREIIEINTTPHILLGGSTGSGKTILLKLLTAQCVNRGAIVYICDFKGGIDYPQIWHEKCVFITTVEEMNEKLERVLEIMEEREKILKMSGCVNIYEYNKKFNRNNNQRDKRNYTFSDSFVVSTALSSATPFQPGLVL